MTSTAEELSAELDSARADLEDFRTRVRRRAIQGYRDGNWNLGRMNEALTRLELEPFTPQHSAATTLEVRVSLITPEESPATLRVAMDAVASAEAQEAIRRALSDVIASYAPNATLDQDFITVWFGTTDSRVTNWP